MKCPVCRNPDVEEYKMRDGIMRGARVSCVGYHCHNCGRIGSALVDTISDKGVSKGLEAAAVRFVTI